MDSLAARVANVLVRNPDGTEGLEIIIVPGVSFEAKFHTSTIIAVTGKDSLVKINGKDVKMWAANVVPLGGTLSIEATTGRAGFRVYLAVRGGFPDIPFYLGAKSTSMGLGGYQGRSLLPGDQVSLGNTSTNSVGGEPLPSLPPVSIPDYPENWLILSLSGPHDEPTYVTPSGITSFYSTQWSISPSSNRLGIRLHSPDRIEWARENGGEGGSHPSNILDNGYVLGTVNINGDTPVILTNEGPDMGGYVCLCTVAAADRCAPLEAEKRPKIDHKLFRRWKLGQLSPGSTVQFRRISWTDARALEILYDEWLGSVRAMVSKKLTYNDIPPFPMPAYSEAMDEPILHITSSPKGSAKPTTVFRQVSPFHISFQFSVMLDLIGWRFSNTRRVRTNVSRFRRPSNDPRLGNGVRLSECEWHKDVLSVRAEYDGKVRATL
jgi:urea carboxylase